MLTTWPSVGVSRPWRKRMSSSATKTFTNRRSWPLSSKRRAAKPGWRASSCLSTSATVAPSTSTSASPPDSSRSCVGIRTLTAMRLSLLLDLARSERLVERVEGRGDDGRGADVGGDGVEGLEPGARDVDDDALVGPEDAPA